MTSGASRQTLNWARAAFAWGPVILYMAAIFLVSAQRTMPLQGKTGLSDKTIHALAYLGLTLFVYRAAVMVPIRRRLDPAVRALLISALYGISDEIHQYFVPGRTMDLLDWLADVAGALTAVLAIILIRTQYRKLMRR